MDNSLPGPSRLGDRGPDPAREQGSASGLPVHTPGDAAPPETGDVPREADGHRAAAPAPTAQGPVGEPRRGADIARAALEAARAAATEKRRGQGAAGQDARRTPARPARPAGAAGFSTGRPRRRGWSGSRPDDRDPQTLGRIASRISGQRGWAPQLANGSVFGRWDELVGSDVAEHATPIALREGELTVQAASTAWATQLRLLQRQLLAQLAKGLGHGVVTSMRIHGPAAPSWRRGPRHVSGRGPRDTYG